MCYARARVVVHKKDVIVKLHISDNLITQHGIQVAIRCKITINNQKLRTPTKSNGSPHHNHHQSGPLDWRSMERSVRRYVCIRAGGHLRGTVWIAIRHWISHRASPDSSKHLVGNYWPNFVEGTFSDRLWPFQRTVDVYVIHALESAVSLILHWYGCSLCQGSPPLLLRHCKTDHGCGSDGSASLPIQSSPCILKTSLQIINCYSVATKASCHTSDGFISLQQMKDKCKKKEEKVEMLFYVYSIFIDS